MNDPYYNHMHYLSYWPSAVARSRETSPIDFNRGRRSLSPLLQRADALISGDSSYNSSWNTQRLRDTISPIRATSVSPYMYDDPPLSSLAPLTGQTLYRTRPTTAPYDAVPNYRATPMRETRNTSIGYNATSPWNATGFYYSPRYPESYRGTASTKTPYSQTRKYFDFDVMNPYRYEYFKFPYATHQRDYGYVPYKYSRRALLRRV